MAKRRPQADHRADTRGGALSGLPHCVSDSAAYLDLTPFERCVLAEVLRRFNGYNNGAIVLSYEEMGERLKGPNACRVNNGRIGRAVAGLINHGFLAEPKPGSWMARRAREYRLTFISCGKAQSYRSATNDYLRWTPDRKKNNGNAASPEQPHSGDARSPEETNAGDAGSPDVLKNGSFALAGDQISGDAGSPLIVKPYGSREAEGRGWWNTDRAMGASVTFLDLLLEGKNPKSGQISPIKNQAALSRCENERCREPFRPDGRGMPQRFCSERCRKRVEDRRRKKRARVVRVEQQAEHVA